MILVLRLWCFELLLLLLHAVALLIVTPRIVMLSGRLLHVVLRGMLYLADTSTHTTKEILLRGDISVVIKASG